MTLFVYKNKSNPYYYRDLMVWGKDDELDYNDSTYRGTIRSGTLIAETWSDWEYQVFHPLRSVDL